MENVSSTPTSTPPRLYRSTTDKVIGGVCGGLAAYFRIDPVLVRLAFVVFALAGGASVLLYIVLWIAVPVGDTVPIAETTTFFGMRGSETTALVLIAIGALWLLANIGIFNFINWSVMWPLLLVGLGAAMLLRGVKR